MSKKTKKTKPSSKPVFPPGPAMREAERAKEVLEELYRRVHRPTSRLKLSYKTPCTIFDSHIGGLPYCPRDADLPVGENDQQLRLLTQINFAQMPAMPPFPDSGILQIFLPDRDWAFVGYQGMDHWTEQKNWRVVYHPDPDASVTEDEVREKLTVGPPEVGEGRDRQLVSSVYLDNLVYKLHFSPPMEEGITRSDFRFWQEFLNVWRELCTDPPPEQFWPHRPGFRETGKPTPLDHIWADKLWDELDNIASSRHSKIGGYPVFSKEDPRVVLPECAEGQCPWDTVLLHLEYGFLDVECPLQGYYPVCFGDCGRATFLIQEADLLRRDFSRVGYYWQDNSDSESLKLLYGPDWKPTRRHEIFP